MDESIKNKLRNLSPEQIRKLLGSNSPSAKTEGTENPAVIKMERREDGVYELSKAQERIWFLSQLYNRSPSYNIPLSVHLKSPAFDPVRFEKAINQLVELNENLRTTFHETEQGLVQKIHPSNQLKIEIEDLSAKEFDGKREELIEELAAEHGNRLFDLSQLPLFIVKILRLSSDEHILLFNLHHIISDGWSNSLISRDSSLLYANPEAELPRSNKFQYIDYVQWEQQWLQSEKYTRRLEFWKNYLADLPEDYHFPRDITTQNDGFEGGRVSRPIPLELHAKVGEFCKKYQSTPFRFYMSCFALLLSLYDDKHDIIIGTPVANRNQRQFQNTYGLFINALPIRLKPDTAKSFLEMFSDSEKRINDCIDNQEVPFNEIIAAVNPQRKLNENTLFSVHFSYQYFPQKNKDDEHMLLPIDYHITKFDINLLIEVAGEESVLSVTYRSQRFGEEKIDRFINHFLNLNEEVIAHPNLPVNQLSFVPEEDSSVIMGKKMDQPSQSWMPLFAETVKLQPSGIAVIDRDGIYDYNQVDRISSSLAESMILSGLTHGDIVIIQAERNYWFIVSVLACFKAGATYLPVDSKIPKGRLKHIITDSEAKLMITRHPVSEIACLDPDQVSDMEKVNSTFQSPQPEDIAYIIYTSGSTGNPKGVRVSHAALLNYTLGMMDTIGDTKYSSYAYVSATDADLGNTSLFLSLATGATLIMPSDTDIVDPTALADFFEQHPPDVMKIAPSHLSALQERWDKILPRKLLISGGEKIRPELIATIRKQSPRLQIINHYGPTESTVGTFTFEIPVDFEGEIFPIGRPLPNIEALVVDQHLKPVPKGVAGELLLGGKNLASGYSGDEKLTKEKFITLNQKTYYRTGDLVFLNKDEQVVFSGRIDRQLKINGFRTDPAEIENLIHRYGITEPVSVFSKKNIHVLSLIAAIETNRTIQTESLIQYLKNHLHPAQVPVICPVAKFPFTINGKLDVSELQELCSHAEVRYGTVLPRDTTEIKLLEIFKQALNISHLSIDDNFFEIGGHSLLAIKLITTVNREMGTHFNIAVLFQAGSIRELATLIRNERTDDGEDLPLITLIEKNNTRKIVWVHPAGGNVMSYYPLAAALADSYDSYAFVAVGQLENPDLSIKLLAEDYVSKLKERLDVKQVSLAGWSMGALIVEEMAALLEKDGIRPPVIMADQPIPSPLSVLPDEQDIILNFIEKMQLYTGQTIHIEENKPINYPSLLKEFIRVSLVPPEVPVKDFRNFIGLMVKHNQIISGHLPSAYHGPILLLKAKEKVQLKSGPELAETGLRDYGWTVFCSALQITEAEGNHISMMSPANTDVLRSYLDDWLNSVSFSV